MSILAQIPIPRTLKAKSRIYDLKNRLDWGEPALTIIDVRDRRDYNVSHITGAVSMPMSELVKRALKSLELSRDIYIYGYTDEVTVEAAEKLRNVGYINVTELEGGVAAWKAADYPIEGVNVAIIA
ncbi:Rhodanese domain protein [Gloeothece citriformis PCC 7424]|uniref:Rhodanese domain protein n=1 Tax=Gloeothece citriformis (strain PCC 7424) TaxID=65393 RepID=B7KHD9_GLOC7|nr:rhodanese-like domain-containing protein [Gloeothece citriformis]ACK69348.1 Rhodanese domain protein [Gloeothece citriformis PCC 7424]